MATRKADRAVASTLSNPLEYASDTSEMGDVVGVAQLNVISYMAGYILRKYPVDKCPDCHVMCVLSHQANEAEYTFLCEKAYCPQGCLVYPSPSFVQFIEQLELKFRNVFSGRRQTRCVNPSRDLNGDMLVTQDQLLAEWSKFLGAKFASPDADRNRPLEHLTAEDDELGDDELRKCLQALRCGKAAGCDGVPVEAYRGSVEATTELFRICRLMWTTERIPAEFVRGMFVMLYKKGSRDDYKNYRAICLLCHACNRSTTPDDDPRGPPPRYAGRFQAGTRL